MVNNHNLYNYSKNHTGINNLLDHHPETVIKIKEAYSNRFDETRTFMVNEDEALGKPKPLHVEYNKQKEPSDIPIG